MNKSPNFKSLTTTKTNLPIVCKVTIEPLYFNNVMYDYEFPVIFLFSQLFVWYVD